MTAQDASVPATARGSYRELFAVHYAKPLFAWSLVARLPLGMTPIAVLLLARGEGASYGVAGAVTAAYGVALGIGAPIAGRLVDRRGPGTVLLRRAFA
jgi:MFS family permease